MYGIVCCRMPGRPCSRNERTPIVDLALAWDWEWDWGFMGFGDIFGVRSYIVWFCSVLFVGFLHVSYCMFVLRLCGVDMYVTGVGC